ncbi:MAG: glycosyltransferase family 4 protein [Candidatus Latescibacteria bacterium]|nr:glycosyltransferase family 4 protein [Candidatus Latescibacterota bacterium]
MHLCIVSLNAYKSISGCAAGQIGGVELQTSLLARWMAQKGHAVSLVTWDEGGPREEFFDRVRVVKICGQRQGIPGFRFFHPKWTSLVRVLRSINADVYYQNGAENLTGQTAMWCGKNGKRFVFVAASNMDCIKNLPELKNPRDRFLYLYGLRHADRVIVQTRTQKEMMNDNFGVGASVVPMPCPDITVDASVVHESAVSDRILWVGRVCRVKRPHLILDLAERRPDLQFDIVGPVYGDSYAQNVHRRGQTLENVAFHGGISKGKMFFFYSRALCLCCTSEIEGFPNTFLEAWSSRLPVVSTYDPDGVIKQHELGFFEQDVDGLERCIDLLRKDTGVYERISRNARNYFLEHHEADKILEKFECIFNELAKR